MAAEEEVGTAVIRVVVDRGAADRDIEQAARDYDRQATSSSRTTGTRSGQAYGDAYSREVRRRLDAAMAHLPAGDINLDDTSALGKLQNIRATMDSMGSERLGIRLSDEEIHSQLRILRGDLEELTAPEHNVRIRTDALAAIAEIKALQKAVGDVDNEGSTSGKTNKVKSLGKDAKESEQSLGLLRTAIEQLGPPLVVLGGGALGASTALVGLGLAGVVAVKGAVTAYKDGTVVGREFAGGLHLLNADLTTLEKTADRNVMKGFQSSVSELNLALPAVNNEIRQSSQNLGQIASNVVGGLVGSLQTFNPLIQQAEGYVVDLSSHFESWATGPGGAHFAGTLQKDLSELVPALSSLVPLVSHFVSSFQPVGGAMLSNITTLSSLLDHIPVGVLQAGTTAYIAFRTAVAVTTGINAATGALGKLAGAETAAAVASTDAAAAGAAASTVNAASASRSVASTGLIATGAGRLKSVLGFITPLAAGLVGTSLLLNTASNATEGWRHSIDGLHSSIANLTHLEANIFNPSTWFNGQFLQPIRDQQIANGLAEQNQLQSSNLHTLGLGGQAPSWFSTQGMAATTGGATALRDVSAALDVYRQKDLALNATLSTSEIQVNMLADRWHRLSTEYGANSSQAKLAQNELVQQEGTTNHLAANYDTLRNKVRQLTQEQSLYNEEQRTAARETNQYAGTNRTKVTSALTTTYVVDPSLSTTVTGLQNYQKQLQTGIKYEKAWTVATGDNTVKIRANGETYRVQQGILARAMDDTNHNYAKAVGLIIGHEHALKLDEAQQLRVANQQTRLSAVMGATEDKYHITNEQLDTYAAAIGVTAKELARGTVSQRDFEHAIGQVASFVRDGSASVVNWVKAVTSFEGTTKSAESAAQLMGQTMVSLQGDTLGYANTMVGAATADKQLITDFKQVHAGVIDLKTGFIDYHNAGAAPVLNDLQQLQTSSEAAATATFQHEKSWVGAKQAAQDATDVFRNDTYGALVDQAHQLGLTDDQAKKLADRYFHWPKNAKTLIQQLGGNQVQDTLGKILNQLREMNGLKPIVDIKVDADTRAAVAKINSLNSLLNHVSNFTPQQYGNITRGQQFGAATGATVPGFGGGDRWPYLLEGGEEVIRKGPARKFRPLLKAINADSVPGMATGGTAGGPHHEHGGFHNGGGNGGGGSGGSGGSGSGGSGSSHRKSLAPPNTILGQVERQITDPHTRLAMLMAPFLEGGGPTPLGSGGWGVGDNGVSFGAYQINTSAHPQVTAQEALNAQFAVSFMKPYYASSVRKVPDSLWASQPARAAEEAAYLAESPSQTYYQSQGAGAVNAAFGFAEQALQGAGSSTSTSVGSGTTPQQRAQQLRQAQQAVRQGGRGLIGSLGGTLQQVRSAESSLIGSIRQLPGDQSAAITWLRAEDKALNKEVVARNLANKQLTTARAHLKAEEQAYRSVFQSSAGALNSVFDISTAGHGFNGNKKVTYDRILAEALQDRNKVTEVRKDVAKLIHEGLDKSYVLSIASAGPAALPELEALMQATPKELSKLNAIEGQIHAQGKLEGKQVADYVKGEGVRVAKALLDGFNPNNKKLAREVRELAKRMFGVGKLSQKELARGLVADEKNLDEAVHKLAGRIERKLSKELGINFSKDPFWRRHPGDRPPHHHGHPGHHHHVGHGHGHHGQGGQHGHDHHGRAQAQHNDQIGQLIGALQADRNRPVRLVLRNGREIAVLVTEETNRLERSR